MQGYTTRGSQTPRQEGEAKKPFFYRLTRHRAFIPILIFIGVILIFSFSSRFSERPPLIKTITPAIGVPGDVMVITGEYFGDVRKGGEVSIAGSRPVSSSYINWSDTQISVQIPLETGSGLVFVYNRTGKSNGMLFTNKNHIPVILEGPAEPGSPYIEEIEPEKGSIICMSE